MPRKSVLAGLKQFLSEHPGLSRDEIADHFGTTPNNVTNYMRRHDIDYNYGNGSVKQTNKQKTNKQTKDKQTNKKRSTTKVTSSNSKIKDNWIESGQTNKQTKDKQTNKYLSVSSVLDQVRDFLKDKDNPDWTKLREALNSRGRNNQYLRKKLKEFTDILIRTGAIR